LSYNVVSRTGRGWLAWPGRDENDERIDIEDMTDKFEIRESVPRDLASIEELYPRAFPVEDLLPLVRELLREEQTVLSLVGIAERDPVGHGMFTLCGIAGSGGKAALLGPLAVDPAWQGQGLGKALVQTGLRLLEDAGTQQIFVLGDPAFYGRFGFKRDDGVAPPYALPEMWLDAWQSIRLESSGPALRGKLSVPQAWRRQALWAP
jgi:putative acetyltransferase